MVRALKKNLLFLTLVLVLLVEFVYSMYIAFNLQVTSIDSFEYLNNARFLIGENAVYSGLRPPVMPLLYIPFMLLNKIGFFKGIDFLGPKLLAVFFSFGSLVLSYLLFRKFLSKESSITAVFLISLNAIFIHFNSAIHTDIPVMFFVVLTFFVYLKAKKSGLNIFYFLTSLLILIVIMTKFTAVLFLIPCIIIYEALSKDYNQLKSKRFWLMLLMPGFLIYVLLSAGYTIYFGFDINSFIGVLKSIRFQIFGTIETFKSSFIDPWYENILALIASSSLPVFALFLFGFVYSIVIRSKKDRLFIGWFSVFFIALTFIYVHYESRYLSPLLPAYYYFVMVAIKFIMDKIKTASIPILIVILLLPLINATNEFSSYDDPVYMVPFEKEVSLYADSITSKENTIYWVGNAYYLIPKKYILTKYDEFMYIYTFKFGQIDFYTKRISKQLFLDNPDYRMKDGFPYFIDILNNEAHEQVGQSFKKTKNALKDGDTLIIYLGDDINTMDRDKKEIKPLYVMQIHFKDGVVDYYPKKTFDFFEFTEKWKDRKK